MDTLSTSLPPFLTVLYASSVIRIAYANARLSMRHLLTAVLFFNAAPPTDVLFCHGICFLCFAFLFAISFFQAFPVIKFPSASYQPCSCKSKALSVEGRVFYCLRSAYYNHLFETASLAD